MEKIKKMYKRGLKLLPYFFLAFLLGFIMSDYYSSDDPDLLLEKQSFVEESEMISAIEKVSPAVVSIVATKDVPYLYQYSYDTSYVVDYQNEEVSGGTGFLVSNDGLLLTNHHVVQDGEAEYTIMLNDGTEYLAQVLSVDPLEDIAVLKIISNGEDLHFDDVVEFSDNLNLKVGQRVLAIGNALNVYGNTVTAGIVSAVDREIMAYNDFTRREKNLSGLIQTDAAINFGNSGGPLVNLNAEVIGMNVAVADFANDIGFAISSEVLIPIIESVKEHGRIVRPFLGVRFLTLTLEEAKEIGLAEDYAFSAILLSGAFLTEPAIYPNGPAAQAGLKENDVIIEVDGQLLNKENSLNKVIRNYETGDLINLKVWRAGDYIDFKVTLGDFSDYIN